MPSKSFIKIIGLLLLLSLGPASIYIMYTRTGGLESRRELAFHKNARFAFMAGTETVRLADLTDWPWQTVCAFGPGLTQAEVDQLLGFSFENFAQMTWRSLEDHWTLLFIDGERETNWGMHRPIIPIRVPVQDIAGYSGPLKGVCVASRDALLGLSRAEFEAGVSPVTATLMSGALN